MNRTLNAAAAGIALALAACVVAGPAMAQASRAGRGEMAEKLKARFAAADKNGDGKLTKDEAKDGMPFVYKHFDEIDKAHAGTVTMSDIAAFAKQMHGARESGAKEAGG